jgi:hypothetical protein
VAGLGLLLLSFGKLVFWRYPTWLFFVLKLDIFKNNGKFGFILKDLF